MKPGHSRNRFDLTNRTALVTGGVGILGKRFCAALADHGANIAVVDINSSAAEIYARELTETYGVNARGFELDVSNKSDVAKTVEEVEKALGSIHILHNNAASKGKSLDEFFESTESYSPDVWKDIMSVNLDGAFFVAQEVGSRMAQRHVGSIIQTSSIYGICGPDQRIYEGSEYMGRAINSPAVYSASKAGLAGLTKYLATYWADSGVRVNTLTPGGVSSGQNKTFDTKYSLRVPMGRMAEADEITGALVFLASDASSYITGQNIVVDGGLSVW